MTENVADFMAFNKYALNRFDWFSPQVFVPFYTIETVITANYLCVSKEFRKSTQLCLPNTEMSIAHLSIFYVHFEIAFRSLKIAKITLFAHK